MRNYGFLWHVQAAVRISLKLLPFYAQSRMRKLAAGAAGGSRSE